MRASVPLLWVLAAGLAACSSSSGPATMGGGGSSSSGGTGSAPQPTQRTDVVTYKNDLGRTGQNLTESVLTLANVNAASFGQQHLLAADGKVDAQPLYLSGLSVQGAVHNVVYLATETDSVYAYDADSGALLWHVSLLPPGESVNDLPPYGCDQVLPTIGITSTPVIDRNAGAHGTIFVVAMSVASASATYHQRLHALDVATRRRAAEQSGGHHRHLPDAGRRHDVRAGAVRGARRAAAVAGHAVHAAGRRTATSRPTPAGSSLSARARSCAPRCSTSRPTAAAPDRRSG